MLKTNVDKIPKISVMGEVCHPKFRLSGRTNLDGKVEFLVGTGGITYNAKIGDLATGWSADHLEPGVSTRNTNDSYNEAYSSYSCIGNEAIVMSGDAKGAKGIVTGKHGGCEHTMVHFSDEDKEKMCIGDKIQVKGYGLGLKLTDYAEINLRSLSPELLEKMNIKEIDGRLEIGVSKIVPAEIMGSGLGSGTVNGDYDITLFSKEIVEKFDLSDIRFGDIVAIVDAETSFVRTQLTGAITIGVVIHSDCIMGGHGPGVTTLMSCKKDFIKPFIDKKANLADMFL